LKTAEQPRSPPCLLSSCTRSHFPPLTHTHTQCCAHVRGGGAIRRGSGNRRRPRAPLGHPPRGVCVCVCVCGCVRARAHTCTHTQSCTRALHHGQTIGTFNIANMVPCTERSCHAVTHARSKTCSSGKQDNASYCALVCVCTTCLLASPVRVILRYQGCWLNCCTVTCTPCW
jgi:hypothetical protein